MRMITVALIALGCSTADEDKGTDAEVRNGLAALGYDTQNINNVTVAVVGDESDGLNLPRDLAFNPDDPGELWVVNRTDDSVSIFSNVGTADQSSEHIVDPFAMHFMDNVSSIAFGAPMHSESAASNFATCQESTNTYNDRGDPNYFMGPTLWSSDPDIFGESNRDAIEYLTDLFGFYTDLGSHLDMLHESPLCMGIAFDYDNVYWAFDGYNRSIYRYDFQEDHGPGYDDHGDGIIARYAEGEIGYEADVPSHLILDADSRLLYIADTQNNRIAILDTDSGVEGDPLLRAERPYTTHYEMDGEEIWTFIDGAEVGLESPSGIELVDGVLLVTDNQTSEIVAFDMDGSVVDRVNTGLPAGSLMGIFARTIEDLWIVDAVGNRVLNLTPLD
ncbi:MAG: hypothetical protein VX127_03320 [Myxococcota bacterium]|nr:hypothetical protein [Myxococcota bacterium]